jgi:hypothetical protein
MLLQNKVGYSLPVDSRIHHWKGGGGKLTTLMLCIIYVDFKNYVIKIMSQACNVFGYESMYTHIYNYILHNSLPFLQSRGLIFLVNFISSYTAHFLFLLLQNPVVLVFGRFQWQISAKG